MATMGFQLGYPFPRARTTAEGERALRARDDEVRELGAVVTMVVPELETVVVHAAEEDLDLRLRDTIPGVRWRELDVGKRLVLTVQGHLAPSVLSVQVA